MLARALQVFRQRVLCSMARILDLQGQRRDQPPMWWISEGVTTGTTVFPAMPKHNTREYVQLKPRLSRRAFANLIEALFGRIQVLKPSTKPLFATRVNTI